MTVRTCLDNKHLRVYSVAVIIQDFHSWDGGSTLPGLIFLLRVTRLLSSPTGADYAAMPPSATSLLGSVSQSRTTSCILQMRDYVHDTTEACARLQAALIACSPACSPRAPTAACTSSRRSQSSSWGRTAASGSDTQGVSDQPHRSQNKSSRPVHSPGTCPCRGTWRRPSGTSGKGCARS